MKPPQPPPGVTPSQDAVSAVAKPRPFLRWHAPTAAEISRYIGAGGLNTVVGVGLFFLLVRIGFDQYVAQITAHVLGSAFNYYMFRVHVFRVKTSSFWRFLLSYVFGYLISLGVLLLVNRFIAPAYDRRLLELIARSGGGSVRQAAFYCSGLITVVTTAIINYFVLKRFVFRRL